MMKTIFYGIFRAAIFMLHKEFVLQPFFMIERIIILSSIQTVLIYYLLKWTFRRKKILRN